MRTPTLVVAPCTAAGVGSGQARVARLATPERSRALEKEGGSEAGRTVDEREGVTVKKPVTEGQMPSASAPVRLGQAGLEAESIGGSRRGREGAPRGHRVCREVRAVAQRCAGHRCRGATCLRWPRWQALCSVSDAGKVRVFCGDARSSRRERHCAAHARPSAAPPRHAAIFLRVGKHPVTPRRYFKWLHHFKI